MSQGCTFALLRRRRARRGGEETFEQGAGGREGGWLAQAERLMPARSPVPCLFSSHTLPPAPGPRRKLRSIPVLCACSSASRAAVKKKENGGEEENGRSAPRGATFSARALRRVRLQSQCRSACIAPLEPLRPGLCTAQAAVDKLTRFLAVLS